MIKRGCEPGLRLVEQMYCGIDSFLSVNTEVIVFSSLWSHFLYFVLDHHPIPSHLLVT